MDLQSVYTVLLRMAKRDGWKVRHCRVPDDSFGDIDVLTRVIRINKDNSINQKVTTLAHELLGHGDQYQELIDYKFKKHKIKISKACKKRIKFYQWYIVDYQNNGPYSEKLMRMVEFCEVDASKRAKRELIKLFPELKEKFEDKSLIFEELCSKESLNLMRESWKKILFKN